MWRECSLRVGRTGPNSRENHSREWQWAGPVINPNFSGGLGRIDAIVERSVEQGQVPGVVAAAALGETVHVGRWADVHGLQAAELSRERGRSV
jgi:hypothetical protein